MPGRAHGLQQLRLGDRAGVVEVQRVGAGRVALRDVRPRPGGRGGEVGPQLRARHAEPLVGQRDLGRAPEHVALPLGAGVVVVRVGGHELPDVGRLRVGEDRAGERQVMPGVAAAGELGAEREVGRVPAGQVGADLLSWRGRLEHRPVLDVVGGRAGVAALGHVEQVLLLRQEPEVVVALDRVRGVAVADPDLHVEDLLARVPELGDPLQAELRLRLQGRVFGLRCRGPRSASARPCSWRCSRTSRSRRRRRTSRRTR